MSSLELPEAADLEGLEPRELARTLAELDVVRRRVEALIAEAVGVADRNAAYAEDGHVSVTGWVRATCNTSKAETKSMVQGARLLHAVPEARAAAHAGLMGVAQMRLLARVHGNPRCAAQLPESAALLVGHAEALWFDEFQIVLDRWQTLADADGAHDAHERAHNDRDAHVSIVDRRVFVDARGGVVAGSAIKEIFDRFCDAEFRTDWDAGVIQWGDRMNPQLLERSGAQRRFDALLAVFTAAAASGVAGEFDPLVNVVVDHVTFEHHLAKLLGGDPEPLDPATVDRRRCETTSGYPIDPGDMVAAALIGHVRRVVFDAAGVVHRSRSPVAVVHRWGS
jgi:Domain of unknown function (DUF222)